MIINFSRKVRKANSKITGGLNEGISGAKTSKTLIIEKKTIREFSDVVNKYIANIEFTQIIMCKIL